MTEENVSSRTAVGVVVSAKKMNKTIVVKVERKVKHPLYGKYIKKSSKMHVHDPENSSDEGDTVVIQQHRPLSKLKNWILVEILNKAGKRTLAE